MNHSTPGLPVHHRLLEFTQTHIHRVGDAIQPSHPLSSPSPPAPNPSQLTVREVQIKTTMRYHCILVGMAIIKKTMDNKCWWVCWERGHFWQKCKLAQSSWKTVGKVLKKLKVELSYNPEIPLLDMYSKKIKTLNLNIHALQYS